MNANAGEQNNELKRVLIVPVPQTKYFPELGKKVIKLMKAGMSINEVALELDIGKKTFQTWVKKYPEFADAVEEGKWFSEGWWAKMGRLGAIGSIKINPKVWDVNMHNRFGWKNHRTFEHTGPNGGPIRTETNINFHNLSDDELREFINERI